jgi:cytochrome c553
MSLLGQTGLPGQTALAEAGTTAPVPSIVEGGGVTLRSVSVNLPGSEIIFPGGSQADTINNDCLLCHSAGMVLDQPDLSRTAWRAEVEKMRNAYKAPFATQDDPIIVEYLVNLKEIASRQPERPPDPGHGAEIAVQGTATHGPACAQCHAFNGVSDSSGAFPRIAGQSPYYLAKQLRDFASGVRNNAIMSPVAKALSADEVRDVAAYYAGMKAPFLPLKTPDPALVKVGETIAIAGDARREIESCNNCHGPAGVGATPAIPYLVGQYSSYIMFTLREWQLTYRRSSPDTMAVVARKLDESEIAAVAAYYQQARSVLADVEDTTKGEK